MTIYDKIFRPKTFTLDNGKSVEQKASRLPVVILVLLAMTALSVKIENSSRQCMIHSLREITERQIRTSFSLISTHTKKRRRELKSCTEIKISGRLWL